MYKYISLKFCLSSKGDNVSDSLLFSWPRGYSFFSCSTILSMKLFLLINVKMPTIDGILTYMSGKISF